MAIAQDAPHARPFLRQFASPLIYILFVAAVIALAMSRREDTFVILVVVCLNATIGTFQEGRAERSMESLRRFDAPHVLPIGAVASLVLWAEEIRKFRARRRAA